MTFKNSFEKGKIVEIIYKENNFFLECDNITDFLNEKEKMFIKHLGKCLGIVKSEDTVDLCMFAQLHVHSEYSILDGMSKLKDIAKKSSGVTAVTDHGNMYNMLDFQDAMRKEGKKAIFGEEFYVKYAGKYGYHLILLAMNEQGKRNIFKLSSMAFDDRFNGRPNINHELIEKYNEGLICTSACLGGEIASLIEKDYNQARKVAEWYKGVFKDRYYLEIQRHDIEVEDKVNPLIVKLAKELSIPIVCANDSHYINESDAAAHEILLCVNSGKKLSEEHFKFDGRNHHYMTDEEVINKFWDIPEAVVNTLEIAKRCTLEIETGIYHLPKYEVPKGFLNEDEYFEYLVDKGFEERFFNQKEYSEPVYKERLEYEKSVIKKMGYSAYFLIVWDYVTWAKNQGILVGPGRGSAAGSLVSYCLKITDLEPIKYGLLFERFLNPSRVSMPDIDMDFEYSRRGEVLDYVRRKYGEDNVCQIVTFGRQRAKNSIRDVARCLGSSDIGNLLCKEIPNQPNYTLKDALTDNVGFSSLVKTNPIAEKICKSAMEIENGARNTSVHACGVVIAGDKVLNFMPTAIANDENGIKNIVSQSTRVEDLGLLKMDFLGLRTMGVIGNALKLVNERLVREGKKPIENYRDIPLNDPYVYREIAKGKSFAVFQIESAGMRDFMTQLYSDVAGKIVNMSDEQLNDYGEELFERMIAGVSLYRPGPIDYIPDYIKGIQNPESVEYDTPMIEDILKPTYGVTIFQEQVMFIVQKLAGFSMADADDVRRAMGKKKQYILDKYKPFFLEGSKDAVNESGELYNIKGCVANGISVETAEVIWNKMSDFAKYAFNKSHAAVYSVLTVVCAWLKFYYPTEYMCAVMNAYIDSDKLNGYISVAKNMGIKVLPPDINKSFANFSIEDDSIRYGFLGIKGINACANTLEAKRKNGNYTCLTDLVERTCIKKSNVQSLIFSGAIDSFGYNRNSLDKSLDNIFISVKESVKDKLTGQMSLFDFDVLSTNAKADMIVVPELKKSLMLEKEKEYTGIYLTEHPLDGYKELLNSLNCQEIVFVDEPCESVVFAGVVTDYKIRYTKKDNKPMATFMLEDRSGAISCVIFPDDFENFTVKENQIVVVKGSLEENDFGFQVIVKSAMDIDVAEVGHIKNIYIRLNSKDEMKKASEVVKSHIGQVNVYCQIGQKLYPLGIQGNPTSALYLSLQKVFGCDNVLYK